MNVTSGCGHGADPLMRAGLSVRCKPRVLSDADFSAAYPATSTHALVAMTGLSASTIARWARRLGLRKSAAYKTSINSGANSPNWKGGRPLRDARFLDPAYVVWRTAVLERDGYRCQRCGKHSRTGSGLHAHHLVPWVRDEALRYCADNGKTYCRDCHLIVEGKKPHVLRSSRRSCACGCGTLIAAFTETGQPRRYVSGHNWRGQQRAPRTAAHKAALATARRGKALSEQHKAKLSAASKGRVKSVEECAAISRGKTGHSVSEETRLKIGNAQRGKRRGPPSAEARANMSAARRKEWTCIDVSADEFRAAYPSTPNAVLAERCKVSITTIAKWAMKLGLRKSRPRHPDIACACGCGATFSPYDAHGNKRLYLPGHASRGRPCSVETRQKRSASLKGRIVTPEHRAKISAAKRSPKAP